jgi:CRP-like cAMP-binding protein
MPHATRTEHGNVVPLRVAAVSVFNPQALACRDCGVRQFALLGALDEAALIHIHDRIDSITVQPGEALFRAGEMGHDLITLRSGVVRLERSSEQGERRILRLAGRADLLGMETVLGQSYAADAIACTVVQACRLPRAMVEELSAQHRGLTHDLMKRWQRALDDADEWLTELSTGTARHRMLRLWLKLSEYSDAQQDGGLVWLPSRHDMGAMLNMTFETASRLISALRKEGIVELVDPRHARLNMDALLAALKEEC